MKRPLLLALLTSCLVFVMNANGQTSINTFNEYSESIEKRDQGIRSRCADEWPSDFSMQKFCRDRQETGYRELWDTVRQFRAANEQAANIAFANCIQDWVDETPDWAMLAFCMDRQYKSYLELQ